MVENETGLEGFIYALMEKSALFYAESGLVSSTNMVCIQWLFDIMIGLLERVGLWTNIVKMVHYSVPACPNHV